MLSMKIQLFLVITMMVAYFGHPTPVPKYVPKCNRTSSGIQNDHGNLTPPSDRIVGGRQNDIEKFPWMVLITEYGLVLCGGSLITNTFILTAAHCFKRFNIQKGQIPSRLGIKLGVSRTREKVQKYEISDIITHEKYKKDVSGQYDIALIKLKEPVELSSKIRTICLPDVNDSFVGQNATVAGWGALKHGGPESEVLRSVNGEILDLKKCQKMLDRFEKKVDENNICAGGKKGKDSCQGDSGCPLFINSKGVNKVIGIVSWGLGCALENVPGVYTNVAVYLHWIKARIGDYVCTFVQPPDGPTAT